jgi:hypothetical protein
VRAKSCDPTCGASCTADSTAASTAGAACTGDKQCSFHAKGACYSDDGIGEPNGWVGGYCLAFGCKKDSECGGATQSPGGAPTGPNAGCFPAASDGSGVCMDRCGMDLDCRAGYTCRILQDKDKKYIGSACFAGCDAAATCPAGTTCVGKLCVDEKRACGPMNPHGWCPKTSWCDNGVCNDKPFICGGNDDAHEPNDTKQTAKDAPMGTTEGLLSCSGDEDWYRVNVPAGTIVRVGIRFKHGAGDIDFVAYNADGELLGSRIGNSYPYSYRDQETDTEYYGFYSAKGGASYYLRVLGYKKAENKYSLHLDSFPYKDGATCTGAGFSSAECIGQAKEGAGLIPFPFPDPNDGVVGGQYFWDTYSNYRFARRELVMLVRHALVETSKAFPGTLPLGLIDVCQMNGITPGYDVGDPRHPESTHDQGGNIDIAYFQTDGNNSAEIICNDGAKHADGFCTPAAAEKHIVDLPRQAFFMAKLYGSSRTRVIGVDQVIAPLILAAAEKLAALPEGDPKRISSAELAGFNGKMASGSGWPFHHHHIHLSLQWWTGASYSEGPASPVEAKSPHVMHDISRQVTPSLDVRWQPRSDHVHQCEVAKQMR